MFTSLSLTVLVSSLVDEHSECEAIWAKKILMSEALKRKGWWEYKNDNDGYTAHSSKKDKHELKTTLYIELWFSQIDHLADTHNLQSKSIHVEME